MTRKKRCRKLTKAEREAVWAPTQENAGAGWTPKTPRAPVETPSEDTYDKDGLPPELE